MRRPSGVVPAGSLLLALLLALLLEVADASYGGPVSRSEIIQRGMEWVSKNVPYHQGRYYPEAGGGGKKYRTDCSGFTSMVWKLPRSETTRTLERAAPCRRISWNALQPGDALLKPGSHVYIFHSWANSAKTRVNAIEEANSRKGTVKQTRPTGAGFFPCRYARVTGGSAPASTPSSTPASNAGGGDGGGGGGSGADGTAALGTAEGAAEANAGGGGGGGTVAVVGAADAPGALDRQLPRIVKFHNHEGGSDVLALRVRREDPFDPFNGIAGFEFNGYRPSGGAAEPFVAQAAVGVEAPASDTGAAAGAPAEATGAADGAAAGAADGTAEMGTETPPVPGV